MGRRYGCLTAWPSLTVKDRAGVGGGFGGGGLPSRKFLLSQMAVGEHESESVLR